jgi:endonuclease/exonuclease/phosphatase (EEP) superfamily protein YafD
VSRVLAIYPATVAVLLVALPLLAPRSGPLTLANIFSIHLTLLAICLLPVAVVRRDRGLGLALGGLALIAVVRFGGDWFSLPPSIDATDDLFRTASWNLELGSRPGDGAVEGIRDLDVDVVVLQELGPDHARAIEAATSLAERYPHRALYPDPGVMGMGLLSAWPIERVEFSGDPSVIEAVIDHDGRPITVINGHPLAGRLETIGALPVAFDSNHRDERLGRIRSRIDDAIGRGESVVVLGDYNVTPTEPGYLQLSEGLLDAHVEVGAGPGWTWRPSRLEFAGMGVIRIDHALSSPSLPPVAVSEDCRRTGDHCMVEAAFSID